LLLCSAISAADSEVELDRSRQQLAGIEQRLEKTMAALARNETVENDVLNELDLVDGQLVKLRRRVGKAKQKFKSLKGLIFEQTAELENRKAEVAQLQVQVQQRLVAMYKSEQSGTMKTIFSAHSLARLLEDYDYLGRVVSHDRKLLTDFRLRVDRYQLSVDRLAVAKKKQQKVAADLKREESALRRTARLKKRYLAAVRNDHTALGRVAADLKARAERLTERVSDLETGGTGQVKSSVSLFALQKGFLPWPVEGRLKNAFGSYRHAELGTLLDNHGINIFAEPKSEVKAVWSGRVAFAKRFMGYGNLMIIDHGDGYYTLYAQVQNLLKKAGDRIEKGALLAYSGFAGADHVYFEIRKGRTPVDPLLWVTKR
jgi:septal ring factor EnvC (AmiA/AmiB activator)